MKALVVFVIVPVVLMLICFVPALLYMKKHGSYQHCGKAFYKGY